VSSRSRPWIARRSSSSSPTSNAVCQGSTRCARPDSRSPGRPNDRPRARAPAARSASVPPEPLGRLRTVTDRWATFDCYGTLIDWFDGVRSQLERRWPDADADALLAAYMRAEARLQEGVGTRYREVMAEALEAVGQEHGATVPPNER